MSFAGVVLHSKWSRGDSNPRAIEEIPVFFDDFDERAAPCAPHDAELQQLVEVWHDLPLELKAAVRAIVQNWRQGNM
ncbi:hypothetical protein [Mucisphaera sp.]|uniref:hypothetical protein n=1 Tax=Mucisphaera sp. TaxID=2913024 RepID=UPI003D0C3DD5